jgi:hypothetical protein
VVGKGQQIARAILVSHSGLIFTIFFIKPRASCFLSEYCTTWAKPQPFCC